ncbi:type II toxin-antitoxin system death-on-curing family toxin [Candidatus Marithrix sp. Canyon 246]|uniref:type II toxin-antitoxin system death-on-curing family toxin n=1 Tax=Candidatus Marithrix sp. Canyon 246 TaxID=1827136 RepID=UPI00084A1A93|nr:type II toxin-antitoxin system death-on-curing family toxin [Candidatus Marithrix sp. Canyon 246]
MKLLTLEQILILHNRVIEQSGGSIGIRDKGILESALAQPYMSYDGQELYPTLIEKVSALGFSLINNHPFIDGNKRIGHAAIEVTLLMNGYEIQADVDTQEAIILAVAASKMGRESFLKWLQNHIY